MKSELIIFYLYEYHFPKPSDHRYEFPLNSFKFKQKYTFLYKTDLVIIKIF